ncbi:ADP-ribosylation factor-like protein 8B [Penicillium soppii]|uniref:ADP-ribosylation factor-like protein 8B n=1 Tax=Penicillium soppii TaxID=69789 RepID=UPI002546FEA9|nr:ADP-ribosylation factor-like protein 8B [Penicillium soppii]KAJ5871816.1 ADP-ribosylation factor-like protein 8B [Penicillium soppii]
MAGIFRTIYDWLLRMFWATEMDVTMIGLQNAGKSSLLRVLALHSDNRVQHQTSAERPCDFEMLGLGWPASVSADVGTVLSRCQRDHRYIVDAADRDALPVAAEELHDLMKKPTLATIPLLVLGNKSDLPGKLSVDEIIDAMNLKSVTQREVSCYGISAKEETNLDAVLRWLIARASR